MNKIAIDASPFHLPRLLLVIGFALVAFGACLDYEFSFWTLNLDGLHRVFAWVLMGGLVVSDREGPLRRRLVFTALATVGLLLYSDLMRHFTGHISGHRALGLCLRSGGFYLWVGAMWLGSPFFVGRAGRYGLALRVACMGLLIYGFLCFSSVISSESVERSMRAFSRERAFCLGLIFAWLRGGVCDERLQYQVGRFTVWVLAGLMAVSCLIGLADLLGGDAIRHCTSAWGLVRVDPSLAGGPVPVRRLEFPMLHFNRTSLLAMMAIMIFVVAATSQAKRWKIERWVALMILPALGVMLLSLSRGALIAAVVGLLVFSAVVSRKALAALVFAGLILLVTMPSQRRDFLMQVFRAETYRPPQGELTSMSVRLWAWDFGLDTIRRHPVTGIGYGTAVVRNALNRAIGVGDDQKLIDNQHRYPLVHVHNLSLEIAVESGLPALLAFLVFCLGRWGMLLGAMRGSSPSERRRLAAWLALEVAIIVAGLVYYMLKHNSGMIFWFAWAYEMGELEYLRLQRQGELPEVAPVLT